MLVIYDPATGMMYSRGRSGKGGSPAGKLLGSIMTDRDGTRTGHVRIEFKEFGRFGFLRHRLAWLYMTGRWPADEIDHKNLIKFDDRWDNLREAGNDQNQANRGTRPHNTSGITGVSFHSSQGKWYAECSIGGVRVLHAYFNTKEEAVAARERALCVQGEFAYPVGHGG